ncbi:MAG: 5'-nucleotidase C-terminal domain-containing protein [Eubacteriales bacterium]|nr:5'-nucleotidase C-terminal domain-containing protein [Eubacteriales bacterium]
MKKRVMLAALAGAALGLMMTACTQKAPVEPETQETEETQQTGKSGKTQITMMYFNQLPTFEALVETSCEDIDLVVEQNSSATLDSESERRLQNHHGSDLIMTTLPGGPVNEYTYDLSAEEFVLEYSSAMTKQLLVDGQTRYIPLPGQYFGYLINETLVEELGFSLPKSKQDIYQILGAAQEKGVGIGVNRDCMGFYNIGENYLANLVFGNYVPDFLSTPEGIVWLESLQKGEAAFSGNMEHSMDFLLNCVEKGYFDTGATLSSNSVTISNKNAVDVTNRMLDRTMVLVYGNTELYQKLSAQSKGDRFTMIPFLSQEGRPGWLISIGNGCLAVNKSLAESGKEKKLEAALKVLALLSTEEGQRAWMEDTDAVYSFLKDGASLAQDVPEGVRETVEKGYVFNSNLPNNIAQYFGRQMNLVIVGKSTLEEAMTAVDNYGKNGFGSMEEARTIVGKVGEDLIYENYNTRREETAIGNLIADAVREYAGAEIALVNGGSIRSSLYEGEVWDADLAAVCPYSNLVVTLKVTGKALREALANGISQTDRGENVPGGRFLQVSGLCYSYRPMKDEKDEGQLLEVTLPDGSPLDDEAAYLVAVTNYMAGSSTYTEGNGDGFLMLNVYDEAEPKTAELVTETGGTFRDALKAYFASHEGEDLSVGLEGRITIEE